MLMLGVLFAGIIISITYVLYSRYDKAKAISDAEPIDAIYKAKHRKNNYVNIECISPNLKMIVIGTEDNRFFTHHGIDYSQIIYAIYKNIVSGKKKLGGSTITQQLAKNIYLSREKTYNRKLIEFFLAYYIESRLSKEQILELYLNIACFGPNKYGAKEAAAFWFNKTPATIGVNEAVALASILPAPSRYNPLSVYNLFPKAKALALAKLKKHGLLDAETAAFLTKCAYDEAVENEAVQKYEIFYSNEYRKRRDRHMQNIDVRTAKRRIVCRNHHHIFFHSLVVDPKLAFGSENDSKHDFETWMITVEEFKNFLDSLYQRKYVVVRLRDVAENAVVLPDGEIPLVISFDDVNYENYMKGYGFPEKIVLNSDGELANAYQTKDGNYIVDYLDGPTILEAFIREHPDFSYAGARGILAITGKEGILGYHNIPGSITELRKIVQCFKDRGWEFACHSYGHSKRTFKNGIIDLNEAMADTERWLTEIAPLVGSTDIYVPPFGFYAAENADFFNYLRQAGFKYFCGVDNTRRLETLGDVYFSNRINIDGLLFARRNYELECYYAKLKDIISPDRLGSYALYGKTSWDLGMHGIVCSKMPTVYLWGGSGEIITESVIQNHKQLYPDRYDEKYCNHLRKYIGKNVRGFDCSGLIKNFLMGGIPNYKYDQNLDWYSGAMLEKAPCKGTIDTLPEERGVCLYMQGHVGIYIGNNWVIEATNNPMFGDGVLKTKLKDRKWLSWFYCPNIDYTTPICEPVTLDPSWRFAEFSVINSGSAIMYYAPANRKNIVIGVNAGHGTEGWQSAETWCHPDHSGRVTAGTTEIGAVKSLAISDGMKFKDGVSEAAITLKEAKLLKRLLLKAGYDVLMVRDDEDVQLDNIARTVICNNKADCHISLHWDYDGLDYNKGCFYISAPGGIKHMEPVASIWCKNKKLGDCLIKGLKDNGNKIFRNGAVDVDITQNAFSSIPSVSIELGNESSDHSEETLNRLTAGLLLGIDMYFCEQRPNKI